MANRGVLAAIQAEAAKQVEPYVHQDYPKYVRPLKDGPKVLVHNEAEHRTVAPGDFAQVTDPLGATHVVMDHGKGIQVKADVSQAPTAADVKVEADRQRGLLGAKPGLQGVPTVQHDDKAGVKADAKADAKVEAAVKAEAKAADAKVEKPAPVSTKPAAK